MMKWAVFINLLLGSVSIESVIGGAILSLKFVSFHNPTGRTSKGGCCDFLPHVRGSSCRTSKCDHFFDICIDKPWADLQHRYSNIRALKYRNANFITDNCYHSETIHTEPIKNQNENHFGSTIGGLPNPVVFYFDTWPGPVQLKVAVHDDDPDSSHELVGFFDHTIKKAPSNKSITEPWYFESLQQTLKIRLIVQYSVHCEDNFYGKDCSVYCKPGSSDHYSCEPNTGAKLCHAGKTCDEDVNECLSDPCNNGGLCVNAMGNFSCICNPGFSGTLCEVNIDECEPDPCHNGALCLDSMANYTCECPDGYRGTNCETNINECEEQPGLCQNGASCIDTPGNYSCTCTEHWEGKWCEVNVDECLSFPCLHHSACIDVTEGFLCVCPPTLTGQYCEEDIDECANNTTPCLNQATCINTFDGFQCVCGAGWEGNLCELDVNECAVVGRKCDVEIAEQSTTTRSLDTFNKSDVSSPIYVSCTLSKEEVTSRLMDLMANVDTLRGKNVDVDSTVTKNVVTDTGNALTSIQPMVYVDGQKLTNDEITAILDNASGQDGYFLKCPLYRKQTETKLGSSKASSHESDDDSNFDILLPAVLGTLGFVLLIVVVIISVFFKKRGCRHHKYKLSTTEQQYHTAFHNVLFKPVNDAALYNVDTEPFTKSQNDKSDNPSEGIANPLYEALNEENSDKDARESVDALTTPGEEEAVGGTLTFV